MTVWNSIDDTYSNFVFYIETKPHFFIFVSLESNFLYDSVEYNIDDKSSIISLYRNEATFLDFASFESIFSMTVWNTINDRYSIFHFIETKPHFLLLPLLQSILSMTVWNTIDDTYSNFVSSI